MVYTSFYPYFIAAKVYLTVPKVINYKLAIGYKLDNIYFMVKNTFEGVSSL